MSDQIDHEARLCAIDDNYRDLWMLKKNLEFLLSAWDNFPVRPIGQLEPRYREALGGFDFLIGNFGLTKVRR